MEKEEDKTASIPKVYPQKKRYTNKLMDKENPNWREGGEYY